MVLYMYKVLPVRSKEELWVKCASGYVVVCKRLCGWVVAHVIIVSPQSQLDLDFDLRLIWDWV